MTDGKPALTQAELAGIEEQFDPEARFRTITRLMALLSGVILFGLAVYHYYTAGYGIPRATTHRGIHMGVSLFLIYLSFAFLSSNRHKTTGFVILGLPVLDWVLGLAALISALYVPWIYDQLAFRIGNPLQIDVVMGTILLVTLFEAVRRSMGWPLPVIALLFIGYAYFGQSMPGIFVHPGADWSGIVNHLYLSSQGVYGTALGVISTYVFHFVLFGVMAQRIGLGQLFIDLATALTGRFAGGPAKVSVVSSALLGSISGSSIANTVTTGALTIPTMIKIGFQRHFAAAVEAASSTGGQITPPVMGAVAFLMVEYLGIPLRTILIAAIVPAFMHFFGVLVQVHLEAKRLGIRGLNKEELPNALTVLREGWLSVLPLVLLVWMLMSGRTPFLAAFWAITGCIAVYAVQRFMASGLIEGAKEFVQGIYEGFVAGAKSSLAVTAAAALVGVVIGVVTLTGIGFKIAFMLTSVAQGWAEQTHAFLAFLPIELFTMPTLALLFTLMMTAVVCILMGCGIPTTANYIIMVAVAAPVLAMMNVEPLVAHFFVFYYGVLADVTPPVALAAYAASGIAGANAFKAGNTAFRLSMGKALVPFMFVFSPSLLLVTDGFTWDAFALAFTGAVLGIMALSAAITNWLLRPLLTVERIVLPVAALLMIAPEFISTAIGAAILGAVTLRQWLAGRAQTPAAA
jgi:TRAP transporter 4TM/12TM fusion protein